MKFSQNQRTLAKQLISAKEAERRHLVVALGGAHAFGFAAPDSAVVLEAIHIAPTENFLGLQPRFPGVVNSTTLEGVDLVYSSTEIGGVLGGVLNGNGAYLECLLGHDQIFLGNGCDELVELARASLSRRCHRHYRSLAWQQRKHFESHKDPTLDELLQVLRTVLTGLHLLRTKELVLTLAHNAEEYGFVDAVQLIEARISGERTLKQKEIGPWKRRLDALFEALDDAVIDSPLPNESHNAQAVDAWLVKTRLDYLTQEPRHSTASPS